MAKVKPGEQTKSLGRARWEIMKRNPAAKAAFEAQKSTQDFRQWFDAHRHIFDDLSGCDEFLEGVQCGRAVGEVDALRQLFLETWLDDAPYADDGEVWEAYRQRAREPVNAAKIAKSITTGALSNKLIVEIDLTRPKEVIMAELGALLARKHKRTEGRLKWLAMVDELLRVWDLRMEGKTFADIGFMTRTSEDTAKKRFYAIFELIHGAPYNRDTWTALFREHFEKELRSRPHDKDLWAYVASLEEKGAAKLPTDAEPADEAAGGDEMSMALILADLVMVCDGCPDAQCRNQALPCFEALAQGDAGALDEFKPDCPKIYNYLIG